MNLKEVSLEEIELHSYCMEDGISVLLHSILFIRAPSVVKPEDYHCKTIPSLTYPRCGPKDVNDSVLDSIKLVRNVSLNHNSIGPNLSKAILILSFFELREVKGFFGFASSNEKVVFERWRIPIVIDSRPLSNRIIERMTNSSNSSSYYEDVPSSTDELEWVNILKTTKEEIQKRLFLIYDTVNTSLDHVPPTMYEYDIEVVASINGIERKDQQSMVTRLINTPTFGMTSSLS